MNNARRKAIADLISRLGDVETLANDIASEIADLQAEEQETFDNMPEGLQQSDNGQRSEAAADALSEAQSQAEDVAQYANDVVTSLETASE